MFREGHYLEIIRASENCMATAIVTVKEKMVEIDKKKVATNKWLNLEDWSKLYKILQRAILRNSSANKEKSHSKTSERKKSTSRLDIVYTFKSREDPTDTSSLPTIKVRVSPVKKKSHEESEKSETKCEKENNKNTTVPSVISHNSPEKKLQRLLEGVESSPEEYVPSELPHQKKNRDNLKYVPSRKSFLKKMQKSPTFPNSNEYTPISGTKSSSVCSSENKVTSYIPNSVSKLEQISDELYDPCSMSSLPSDMSEAYVPSCKSSTTIIEEYEPDFSTKTMKFDNSYVPSSKRRRELSKNENVKKKNRRNCEIHNQMQYITEKSLIKNNSKSGLS